MPDQPSEEEVARIRALPLFEGPVAVSPLPGGITNRNFLISDALGRFVVRFGEDIPVHGVMRFNELAAARAAEACGLSPAVVFHGPGVMVTRFLGARALEPADVRDPPTLLRIVELLRRCHRDVARAHRGPVLAFWVFQVLRSYLATLGGEPCRIARRLPDLARAAASLEARVGPVTLVFGHNDLLSANILDDGARLWLIDWDYAGLNTPLFEGELSGGQRQGVAIARAMHFRSKVMILDEPTNHLSVKETRKVIGFVRSLREQGVTAIFISHNLHHVFACCDRVVAMALGRVVLDRPAAETSIEEVSAVL